MLDHDRVTCPWPCHFQAQTAESGLVSITGQPPQRALGKKRVGWGFLVCFFFLFFFSSSFCLFFSFLLFFFFLFSPPFLFSLKSQGLKERVMYIKEPALELHQMAVGAARTPSGQEGLTDTVYTPVHSLRPNPPPWKHRPVYGPGALATLWHLGHCCTPAPTIPPRWSQGRTHQDTSG